MNKIALGFCVLALGIFSCSGDANSDLSTEEAQKLEAEIEQIETKVTEIEELKNELEETTKELDKALEDLGN